MWSESMAAWREASPPEMFGEPDGPADESYGLFVSFRTARKARPCDACGAPIAVGQRYCRVVQSPDYDANSSGRWITHAHHTNGQCQWRCPACGEERPGCACDRAAMDEYLAYDGTPSTLARIRLADGLSDEEQGDG
jgi:hypothetical protein